MAISPWRVGQQLPAWTIPVMDDSGNPISLSGLASNAFALTIRDLEAGTTRAGSGSFAIQAPASSGVVVYTWSAADVAQAGSFEVQLTITFNGLPMYSDAIPWVVKYPGMP